MKLMIIGIGFLAQYVMPCYERLMGDDFPRNVLGIKGSARDLEKTQKACSFPVQVRGTDEALREMNPDIIVLAVRPHQIADVTRNTLVPYYDSLRKQGRTLPDLYSFAPDPTVDFFYDTLGPDVNEANLLPNMIRDICGHHVAETGVSFVAFDPRRQWPAANRKRALEFLKPTGTVVEIDGDKAIPYLAAQCACHLMFELCYIAQDVLKKCGQEITLSQAASAYRHMHRSLFDAECVHVLPDSADAVDGKVQTFMAQLLSAWRAGVLRFTESERIPTDAALRNIAGTMEAYLMEAQLEPKEQLLENTKNHATPGGFLEMCLKTFYGKRYEFVADAMYRYLCGDPIENAMEEVENIAFTVAKAISDHGKTVAGVKKN